MNPAKIRLSADELLLIQNADLLLTKNRIIAKVYDLFGELAEELKKMTGDFPDNIPPEIFIHSAKISKGENYNGLPYVMLDYPRCFGKEDVFAIRTMLWWGNFMSVTLHLKGIYKAFFSTGVIKNIEVLREGQFYISIHEDEWRHDFEDNYRPLTEMDIASFENILADQSFCKIAARLSLDQWNDAKEKLLHLYRILFTALIVV
jgi:hypothetical protein